MKYKVEGESAEGNYLDGQSFDTEQEANQEIFMLRAEFPENSYWVEVIIVYLWLKRLFYGCDHKWVFLTKFQTYEYSDSNRPVKTTSIHRCTECMKIRKDVFK